MEEKDSNTLVCSKSKILALYANVGAVWKFLAMTNTLANNRAVALTAVKCFIYSTGPLSQVK